MISDISVFERVTFENLETLLLDNNNINIEENNALISYLSSKIKNFSI